jgi:hypothetical protein
MPPRSRLALLAATLGLLGVPLLPSVAATAALSDIRDAKGELRGRGLALLGLWLGLLWGAVAAVGIYVAVWPEQVYPRLFPEKIRHQEELAARALLAIAQQEDLMMAHDFDGNKMHDYWVDDVSGLYRHPMETRGHPDLVGLDIARADRMPFGGDLGFEPRDGYVFLAVPGVDRRTQFAFTAYPERFGVGGTKTFYIDERKQVWERELGGMPCDGRIEKPEKEGWKRRY